MTEAPHIPIAFGDDTVQPGCFPRVDRAALAAKIKALVASSPQRLRLMRSQVPLGDVDAEPGVGGDLLRERGMNGLPKHGGEGVFALAVLSGGANSDVEVEACAGFLNANGDLDHGAVSEAQRAPEEQG